MTRETQTLLPSPLRPPSERRALAVAIALFLLGAGVLSVVLTGLWRPLAAASLPAPPLVVAVPTPVPGSGGARGGGVLVAQPSALEQDADLVAFLHQVPTHVPAHWEAGFYPLYDTAGRTFAVNWLLLASVHRQESAFSTARSTYHGLNFAGCCGGPMQFNVTNGPVSTWKRVRDAYRFAARPAAYNHPTARHPSIYDDFDAMMAAARLLSVNGAGMALDGSAWGAAYDYYGHDATGVTYADQVLARAISWSEHGFCINCNLDPAMVAAVHAAYGAPALAALAAPAPPAAAAPAARARPTRDLTERPAIRQRRPPSPAALRLRDPPPRRSRPAGDARAVPDGSTAARRAPTWLRYRRAPRSSRELRSPARDRPPTARRWRPAGTRRGRPRRAQPA